LTVQHETAHQLNFIHKINGEYPATIYNNSFEHVEGQGFHYTFQSDHIFLYNDGDCLKVGTIEAGYTTRSFHDNLLTSDSGYNYRVRTTGDDSYNRAEEVTDGHIAETGGYGTYTSDGIGTYQEEVFGLARQEVNQAIFDEILAQIDWDNVGD
jgi:hypothetical protein